MSKPTQAPCAFILVYSTSHAIRAEKILGKAGIACKLVPVPREFSSDCGVCVRVAADEGDRASQALAAARLEIAGLRMQN
jgi:hypothetical protein